jgi:hypothetical protein
VPIYPSTGITAETIYCPYTDKEIDTAEATPDHIIPLALGGHNAFAIPVAKDINSTLGHTAEAGIASDPIVEIRRARLDVRGHSNTLVQARWKKTRDEMGNPLQAIIDRSGFSVFDPKLGRRLADAEAAGRTFTSELRISQFARVPFAAKVALGTGYYLFRDLFRSKARHEQLRLLLKPINEISEAELRENHVTYLDRLNDANNDRQNPLHRPLELLVSALNCSAVVVSTGNHLMAFTIGILNEWEATIVVPAEGTAFPAIDEYDLGHVVALRKDGLVRISLREALTQLQQAISRKRGQQSGDD